MADPKVIKLVGNPTIDTPIVGNPTADTTLAGNPTIDITLAGNPTQNITIAGNPTQSLILSGENIPGTRVTTIPINQGYSTGLANEEYDIMPGLWVGSNLRPDVDGKWKPMYIPTVISEAITGTLKTATYGNDYDVIIGTTDGFYYKAKDGLSWTTITTAKVAGSVGCWCQMSSTIWVWVQGTSEDALIFTYSSGYTAAALTGIQGSYVTLHQDRGIISSGNTLYYSDEAVFNSYINTLSVGASSSNITGMFSVNGNLIILKEDSIWVKQGEFETDMAAINFSKLEDVGAIEGLSCCADGKVFFANASGVFMLDGQSIITLSGKIELKWRT